MTTSVPSFSPGDFGKAAEDYAAHRPGFPASFFARMTREGVGVPGQRLLDLGTGTGTLARGFAAQGAEATGVDISAEMLAAGRVLAEREGVRVRFVRSEAEGTGLPSASFDAVTAGQCWHWFDGPAAAAEASRLLKRGGVLVICHFSYLPIDGNAAQCTEELILRHNPAWPLAGLDGRYEGWAAHMAPAGFRDIRSFWYDEDVAFTHEAWRGRIRACNGVLALRDAVRIAAFDGELEGVLRKGYPAEPLLIPHRVFCILGRRP